MEARLFTFCFFCLMALTPGSSLKYPSPDTDDSNYDLPSDQAADFFRLLLLSRYGLDSPDYTDPEQTEQIYNSDDKEMPENYGFAYDRNNVVNSMHPFRQAIEQYAKEHQGTTEGQTKEDVKLNDYSTTTAAPDVLASMPPVTPDKGQKEYVMLRPPVDNHHKIEHWMQSMANGMMGSDQIMLQKRKSGRP